MPLLPGSILTSGARLPRAEYHSKHTIPILLLLCWLPIIPCPFGASGPYSAFNYSECLPHYSMSAPSQEPVSLQWLGEIVAGQATALGKQEQAIQGTTMGCSSLEK